MMILMMGLSSPYIIILGYVWVDIFTPQILAYSILPSIPVSLVMGLLSFVFFLRLPKDSDIKLRNATIATLIFSIWITMTLMWAEISQEYTYQRWDTAIKSLLISCIIPFFLRTKIQIEAYIWTITLSGIAHCIATGIKVIISGGGYGAQIGLVQVNSGWGESSSMALYAITLIPICIFLLNWQTLFPHKKIAKYMIITFIILALTAAIGTFARTGLICAIVLGVMLFISTKNRLFYLSIGVSVALIVFYTADQSWLDRMSTTNDGTEGSAMGRVAVWFGTLEYLKTHPFGGSFDVFRIIQSTITLSDGTSLTVIGKAFHSIYFQLLGEAGYPGLVLYSFIVLFTWQNFNKIKQYGTKHNKPWLISLGSYMLIVIYVYLVGGAFVGIAYQSYFYYISALSVAVLNLIDRKDTLA